MFRVHESGNTKMEEYAESIYEYLMANELFSFDIYDYDEFAEELDMAIQNGEIINIPELEREDAFKLAINIGNETEYDDSMDGDFDSAMTSAGFGTDEDYGYYGDDMFEGIVKDTNEIISMMHESLASKKAKKLGLVHVGFGNYAEEEGGQSQYKTVNGKLKKVKGAAPKKPKSEPKKETPKVKEKEPEKDKKPKKSGITDVRRVSGEKFTYEFKKDGRKYKFTLNKLERKQLKGEGSVVDIIKQRMKKKELKQKDKEFKKGKHVDKSS